MAKVGYSKNYDSRAPKFAISVSVDRSQLTALAQKISQWAPAVNQAMVNAINDTLVQGRRKAAQLMTEKYDIKQKDVINAVKMERANRSQSSFTGRLTIHPSRRPGLGKFGARNKMQKRKKKVTILGVNYTAKRQSGKQFIRGAFASPRTGPAEWVAIPYSIAKVNGKPHPKAGTTSRTDRLHFLQGPSVWGMFASLSNRGEVDKRMAETFMDNLAQQINFQFLARTGQIKDIKSDKTGWIRRSGKRAK